MNFHCLCSKFGVPDGFPKVNSLKVKPSPISPSHTNAKTLTKMIHHCSIAKPTFSISIPTQNHHQATNFLKFGFQIRCESGDASSSQINAVSLSSEREDSPLKKNLMESEVKKSEPYPGGIPKMGPFTGRDPNVKKPSWLRQKAPQGERFQEVKESLSRLNLNTVCEEAQCPNIGEVSSVLWSLFVDKITEFNQLL